MRPEFSSLPFHMAMRDERHMVSLIRQGDAQGRVRTAIGVPYSGHGNPRERILEQWAMNQCSPRREMSGTVFAPLPPRHQAALQPLLAPFINDLLRGGLEATPQGRRDLAQGVKARLHLGPDREAVVSGQPPMHHGGHANGRGG